MPSKPFIAARIPEELNQALNAHSEDTGESKTQALINALSQYLGVAYAATDGAQTSANPLSLLSRIVRLEDLIEEMQRSEVVIRIDNDTDNTLEVNNSYDNSPVINVDNIYLSKAEGGGNRPALFPMASDNTDNNAKIEGAISTKDLASMAEMKASTIKARSHKGTIVEYNGIVYKPISKGARGYWWIPQ